MSERKGGIIFVKVNGERQDAKGNFTYNIGNAKRDPIVGSDQVHGFTEKPQVAFIEGEITDRNTLDLDSLTKIDDATVTLELANGKVISLRNAWFSADGTGNTEEGNIAVRFESKSGEEIR